MGKSLKTTVPRGLAILSFVIAPIVMLVNKKKVDDEEYNITFIIRYNFWSGFKFCRVVEWIAALYNFVVLLIPDGHELWNTVVYTDVIMNILVGASLGVWWQTYTLIIQGNTLASWPSICGVTPGFCSKVLGSLITSTFGFVISIGLQMCTIHILMTEER